MAVRIRDLHGIDDYRAVVELEQAIWGYTDWSDVITVPVPGNDDAIRSVSLITAAVADVIKEARSQMPMREVTEDLEAETYSTDAGSEGDADADRKRRRPRRKRRPKPEAIAARLKTDADTEGVAEAAAPGAVSDTGA